MTPLRRCILLVCFTGVARTRHFLEGFAQATSTAFCLGISQKQMIMKMAMGKSKALATQEAAAARFLATCLTRITRFAQRFFTTTSQTTSSLTTPLTRLARLARFSRLITGLARRTARKLFTSTPLTATSRGERTILGFAAGRILKTKCRLSGRFSPPKPHLG